MLKKVFRYEMKAAGRFLLPVTLASVLSLLGLLACSGVRSWLLGQPNGSTLYDVGLVLSGLNGIMGSILFTIIIGLFIGALAVRFYKAFSGAEAYTTFSLPVKVSTQLSGHLLCAAVYSAIASLLGGISMVYYALSFSSGNIVHVTMMNEETNLRIGEIPFSTIALVAIGFFFFLFINTMAGLLQLWACIGIGGQFGTARIPVSVAAYFIINIVETVLCFVFVGVPFCIWVNKNGGFFGINNYFESMSENALFSLAMQLVLWMLIIVTLALVLFSVVHFFLCKWLFTKKLNLN